MEKIKDFDNIDKLKSLFLAATDYINNGYPVSIQRIEKIHTFNILKGDFIHGQFKISGIATISIAGLTQLYDFEGYANEKEIIGSIIISKSH